MRRLLCLGLGLVTVLLGRSALALAQGRVDTLADSTWVSEKVLKNSFDGIVLSRADEEMAFRIIKKAFVSLAMLKRTPDKNDRFVAICDERDALLMALLRNKADSARYLEQSAIFRPPREKRS